MPGNWLPLTHLRQVRRGACLPAPVIVFLRTGGLPGWREDVAHAVVLVGLSSDLAIIHDPARDSGPDEIGLDALLLAWSEMDYYCAVVTQEQVASSDRG